MNNHKSVSEDIQAFVNKLKDQGYYFDIDSQEDAESVWQIIDEFYKQGIQEGRRLENKGIAEYIQKIIDFKTMLDRPENKRDIRILEELIKAIQSRNEGSEK